jgi:23S rRNA (cytidine1920-2'-O)/16S rRNA (cytidine1409-2'-O)-methyltransferase
MERTNARTLENLPEPIELTTVDASFISLALLWRAVRKWMVEGGDVIALVKPQFEAGPENVGKGGVVRDPEVHVQVLKSAFVSAVEKGLAPRGLMPSPLQGPKGNIEFLLWCQMGARPAAEAELLKQAGLL